MALQLQHQNTAGHSRHRELQDNEKWKIPPVHLKMEIYPLLLPEFLQKLTKKMLHFSKKSLLVSLLKVCSLATTPKRFKKPTGTSAPGLWYLSIFDHRCPEKEWKKWQPKFGSHFFIWGWKEGKSELRVKLLEAKLSSVEKERDSGRWKERKRAEKERRSTHSQSSLSNVVGPI